VAQAQVAQPDNPVATDGANQVSNLVTVASVNADSAWHSTPIDQNSTEWTKTEPITNAVTGLLEPHIRRYIEVSSSLNFISNGALQRSADLVELMTNGGGAAALQGPTKAYFAPTLEGGADPTLTLVCSTNTVIQISPIAVYYVDDSSGKSVLLSSIRNGAEGELVGQNQVVYRGSMEGGLRSDIRFTYTHGACEADLLVLSQPVAPPEAYGLSPQNTRLELLHLVTAPLPRMTSGPTVNGLSDLTLDYDAGGLQFPQGYAFSTGD